MPTLVKSRLASPSLISPSCAGDPRAPNPPRSVCSALAYTGYAGASFRSGSDVRQCKKVIIYMTLGVSGEVGCRFSVRRCFYCRRPHHTPMLL